MKKIADAKKLNEILKRIDNEEKMEKTNLCFVSKGSSEKSTLFL
jgi:hypothetical protein